MVHEITVVLSRPLRQVVRIASDAPPAPAASSLLRRVEEEQRRQQQEQQAITEERRQVAAALAGLTAAAKSFRQDVDRLRAEMEAAAVELATAVASRLIHKVINAEAFGVQQLVHELTARLEGDRAVTVFLHPDDLKLLRRRAPETGGGQTIQLKADAALGRGDCRAVSGDVSLISQLRAQLAELHAHLRRSVAHDSEDASAAEARSRAGRIVSERWEVVQLGWGSADEQPAPAVGEQCDIVTPDGRSLAAEVVGFNGGVTHLVPYESADDVRPGMDVSSRGRRLAIPVGRGVLGRVMDGLGRPIDGPRPACGVRAKARAP